MIKKENITDNIKPLNKDLEALKQNFPNCFDKGGGFDFEKFKNQLSKNEINFSKESYGMDWLGKSYARLLATDEATTLLKKDENHNQKKENKNSENLLIKGDNLEVLKHLSNAYYEKVKMIYIDPPYNTGNDGFVYADDRKFTVKELQELAGLSEEKAKRILDFTQSKSNSHSAWLTFMYPRLYIAKQLLKDDGVIFVSIDDNEVAQLRLSMDEVFGEENFFATLTRRSMHTVRNSSKDFNHNADYVLVYAKYKGWFEADQKRFIRIIYDKTSNYPHDDNDGKGKYKLDPLTARNYAKPYEFTFRNGVVWSANNGTYPRYSIETLKSKELEGEIVFNGKDPKAKRYLKDVQEGQPPDVILNHEDVGFNSEGTKELRELLGEGGLFSQPKNTKFVQFLTTLLREKKTIILDFFAGSGTTGDAVMQLNAQDGGNRKYILVQLPEEIDKKKNETAYNFVKNELKVKTPTIFDITKERLIRASKKIQKEKELKAKDNGLFGNDEKNKELDLGFKVFETMPIWEDYHFEAEELEMQSSLFDESKLTQEDLKALLVTWKTYDGISLTKTIQETNLNSYTAHYCNGKLYLMDKGFKTANLKALLEKIDSDKDFNPTTIIAFAYHFDSKNLREISENIKSYANKKSIDIDFIMRC